MPEAFGMDQYGANFARGVWFVPLPCVGSVRLFTHNALIRQLWNQWVGSGGCFIRRCYVTIAWDCPAVRWRLQLFGFLLLH